MRRYMPDPGAEVERIGLGLGRLWPIVAAAAAIACLGALLLSGCAGGAGGDSAPQTSGNTETTMTMQPPPIDLEAPAEYQTATFAFG